MIMISARTVFVIIVISKNATKNTHKLTSLLPLSLSLSEVYLSPFQNFSLSLSSLCSLSLPNLSLSFLNCYFHLPFSLSVFLLLLLSFLLNILRWYCLSFSHSFPASQSLPLLHSYPF